MKRYCTTLLPAFLMIALLLAGAGRLGAQQPDDKKPVRVAVVNLKTVLDKYQRRKDSAQKLQDLRTQQKAEMEKMQKDLQAKERALQDPLDRQKLEELDKEILKLRTEFEVQRNLKEYEYRQAYIEQFRKVKNDIREACKKVAKTKNFDLVIDFTPDDTSTNTVLNFDFNFQEKLLYYSESVDITDLVVVQLNKDYRTVAP